MNEAWLFSARAEPPGADACWYPSTLDALDAAAGPFVWNRGSDGSERGGVDATPTLWAYARGRALSVAHLWDASDVVRRYLETGNEGLKKAVEAAVEAAVEDFKAFNKYDSSRNFARSAARGAAKYAIHINLNALTAARESTRNSVVAQVWSHAKSSTGTLAWETWSFAMSAAEKQLASLLLSLTDVQALPKASRGGDGK